MTKIPALTGVRFFAAAAIVLTHSQGRFFAEGVFAPFFLDGAVALFFVLSGFVLTINAGKYRSWTDFLVARIGRLWPGRMAALVFVSALAFGNLGAILWGPGGFRRLLLNVLLLQAWSPNPAIYFSFDAPAWSISVEMAFYAAFPAALALLSRHPWRRIAVLWLLIAGAITVAGARDPAIDAPWLGAINPISCFPAFLAGMAAASFRLPDWRPSVGAATGIQAAAIVLAFGANALSFATYTALWPGTAIGIHLRLLAPGPFYAALILALARYDGLVSRVLSLRALVYGGEISYSLYLFHLPIILWAADHRDVFAGAPLWARGVAVWLASLAVAAASYAYVEGPARRFITAGWRRVRPPFVRSAS